MNILKFQKITQPKKVVSLLTDRSVNDVYDSVKGL